MTNQFDSLTGAIESFSEGYWGGSKLSVAIRLREALIKDSVDSVTQENGSNYDDNMNGQAGTDVMEGLNGNDYINGHGGNDFLYGGEGNDEMRGGNGHDWLLGGQDHDFITGGDGNDFLAGGEGVNHLKGGDGFDLFVLDKGGVAIIHDFTLGEDKIFLGDNRLFPGEVNKVGFESHAGFASLVAGDRVVAVVANFTQDQLQSVSDQVFI